VAHDRLVSLRNVEISFNNGGKLFSDVSVHIEVLFPPFSRGIAVVTSAKTNSPVFWFNLGDLNISRTCIGEHNGQSVLSSCLCKASLIDSISPVASQPTKVVNHIERITSLLWNIVFRHEDLESHEALIALGPMSHFLYSTPECFLTRLDLYIQHFWHFVFVYMKYSS